jgi:hypothetical protein
MDQRTLGSTRLLVSARCFPSPAGSCRQHVVASITTYQFAGRLPTR